MIKKRGHEIVDGSDLFTLSSLISLGITLFNETFELSIVCARSMYSSPAPVMVNFVEDSSVNDNIGFYRTYFELSIAVKVGGMSESKSSDF